MEPTPGSGPATLSSKVTTTPKKRPAISTVCLRRGSLLHPASEASLPDEATRVTSPMGLMGGVPVKAVAGYRSTGPWSTQDRRGCGDLKPLLKLQICRDAAAAIGQRATGSPVRKETSRLRTARPES